MERGAVVPEGYWTSVQVFAFSLRKMDVEVGAKIEINKSAMEIGRDPRSFAYPCRMGSG
jgi:hypothetical protein